MSNREVLLNAVNEWVKQVEARALIEYGVVTLPLLSILSNDGKFEVVIKRVPERDLADVFIFTVNGKERLQIHYLSKEYLWMLTAFLAQAELKTEAGESAESSKSHFPKGYINHAELESLLGTSHVTILNILRRGLSDEWIVRKDIPTLRYIQYAFTPAFIDAALQSADVESFKDVLGARNLRGFGPTYFATLKDALTKYRASH